MDDTSLLGLLKALIGYIPKSRDDLRERATLYIRQLELDQGHVATRQVKIPRSPTELQRRLEAYRGPYKLRVSTETLRKRLKGETDWPLWDFYRVCWILGLNPADHYAATVAAAKRRRRWLEAEAARIKRLRGH